MPPLWKHNGINPSPKQIRGGNRPNQNKQLPQTIKVVLHKSTHFIKGVSLFVSLVKVLHGKIFRGKISRGKVNGSMTVEAAVVLPLFLFFFLNMGCAIEIIRLHGNLELALCDVGNRMAVYGCMAGEKDAESAKVLHKLTDIGVSYTYVKGEIKDYVGEDYLEQSPMAGGADGLVFLESDIFTEQDEIELIVTYKVQPFVAIVGFKPFRMANHYYGHLWNGYRLPEEKQETETEDIVYVTETGKVYHEQLNCSHLSLSIREVSHGEAYRLRNENGERYELCHKCGRETVRGMVYITLDGTGIHNNRNCPGLKRTIKTILRKDAGGYRPCRRCA